MHSYSMRGCSRERYVFFIALAAVAVIAIAKQAAGYFGVVISLTAFSVFGVLFFVFDRWLWSIPWVQGVVGIPNLSGTWSVSGETNGADGVPRSWSGTVSVKQTWSSIAISIDTKHSRSRSKLAAIEDDPGHGYRVSYVYENRPKEVDTDLRSHCGSCEVVFDESLRTADAAYFNDHQRRTIGTMKWMREPNIGASK